MPTTMASKAMGRQMGGRRAARPHRAPRTVAVATPNKGGASSKKPVQPPSALAEVASEVKVASTEVDALADYVKARGGRRVIRKVLIANNGMAATKSILSMRRWCYLQLGDDKAVEFVAMASPEDLKANAEYIRLADDFVEVPSGSNKNNYANVDLIVDIAEKEGCDAVWPGWGHASENPKLPATLKARGIQFIGPTAPVMSVLGDKIAANILAQTAKVPSIPWSGDGLTADLTEEGTIPDEIFQKAMVTTADEAVAAAERIGYPVMLKASEGGGGKGIRMSDDEEALRGNFEQVKAEVPGSPMFMMQLCSQARHLEVQIVGDEHGNAVALNGRDCSTQRRFQKIFEEGPPTVAPREIFREMEKAAQRLTQNIGYIGAGTVEYLFNAATGNFFFLELNPRLQVEHPVTEGLTGVNLPSIQLQVAMGIPLDRIPDVRRLYARDEDGDDKIDFMEDEYVLPERHVLAARITAENPDEGFKPTSGSIERISFQSTPNVWGYFSVGANGGVHEFADSQFGHLFASGPTREDARKALILALKDVNVYGEVRTAVDYLVELASTDAFRENTIDTSWLDGLIAKKSVQVSQDPLLIVMCAAMARAKAHTKEVEAQFAESWKRGQLAACNDAAGLQSMLRFPVEMTFRDVAYTVDVTRKSQDSYSLKIRGASSQDGIVCRARERSDGTLIITPMGAQRAFQVVGMEEPLGLRLVLDGQTFLLPNQNDPSELRTDVTGKLIRFLKKDGDEIQQGKPYAEVESMKMVMQLVASESGKITLKKPPGSVIEAGDLLAGLELEDPSKVKRATPFSGTFEPKGIMPSDGNIWQPDFSMMSMDGDMDEDKQVALDAAVEAMDLLLDGYEHDVESTVQQFITGLQEFVASQVELNGTEKWEMAMEYVGRVVSRYLAVEARFGNTSPEGAVAELVQAHAKDSPATITSAVLARSQVARRSDAIASLLRQLPSLPAQVMQSGPVSWQGDFAPISEDVKSDLERLSRLRRPEHGSVALAAANILLEKKLPSVDQRLEELRDLLAGKSAYKSSSGIEIAAGDLDALVGSPLLAVDLLPQLFGDDDTKVREAAITVFVKRMYRSHKVSGVEIDEVAGLPVAKFKFQYDTPPLESPMRFGMLAVASVMSDFEAKMPQLLERYQELQSDVKSDGESEHGPINVLHLACTDEKATLAADDESAACAEAISASVKSMGEACGLKYVNVIAHESKQLPRYYTYTAAKEYAEDPLYRGCRPTLAHLLELSRLQNYELTRIPTFNRDLHIYSGAVTDGSRQMPQLLLRRITHSKDVMDGGLERIMTKALDGLDLAVLDPRGNTCSSSRIYVNSIPEIAAVGGNAAATARELSNRIADFVSQNAARLLKLKVDEIEFKVRIKSVGEVVPVRLMASSLSGQWLKMDIFREYLNPVTGAATRFCTYGSEDASQPEVCFLDPYPIPGNVDRKRTAARRIGSTYIYDFLGIFEKSVVSSWVQYQSELKAAGADVPSMPAGPLFTATELVLDEATGQLTPVKRQPGENNVGMVAWKCSLKTPEYPAGREIVLIGNDCTYQSGSFGVSEDDVFAAASKYARETGLPRLYISCNAGARIGLVESLKSEIQAEFVDPADPTSGLKYLYLSREQYDSLPEGSVIAEPLVEENGEERMVLSDIIGDVHGIGVENLRGSGMIAGETSRAYEETFTLSYVTGRSVGIGAYLCRLGSRVVQMQRGPMILTGYGALNKLLGRSLYTSQDQLGGPGIMMPNGVSHLLVQDDQEGVNSMLRWLSYVPDKVASSPPILSPIADPVDRDVEFTPKRGVPYNVRHMLAGTSEGDDTFLSGFFDKDSFVETLPEWGKTVVTGRGRLGGIPMGCVAVEVNSVECRTVADPGDAESREVVRQQAGQVWFPDSAYKTAQSIEDFNREGLPLIVFANWRGFSGGTRDMADSVLKYGAMVVDALVGYKQPVFVYIPPGGELRGGAWVVVDPTINSERMEMFADSDSRGGILEPAGICEVKFRAGDVIKQMHRLDDKLRELDADPVANAEAIKAREEVLMPVYQSIALEFADQHDRGGRMLAKGVVSAVLDWKNSRRSLHSRLMRRLNEQELERKALEAAPLLSESAKLWCARFGLRRLHEQGDSSVEAGDWDGAAEAVQKKWDSVADEKAATILTGDVERISRELESLKRASALEQALAAVGALDDAGKAELIENLKGA
ncbi:carboxyl transferase domain [Pycnococcus provasolii]|uniref:Carboxyl transferase domain n=2 Tax=Pycnococcus provasolii TaxID=41880 RepID=A0A830I095_9CHLO|nr:carboxyl transferase domain [Pycnococcus provasolii]